MATPEDADRIAELEIEIFPDNCLNEFSIDKELKMPGWNFVVGDPIHGYILSRLGGGILDITRLGILPAFHRRGLGRQLLATVLYHRDSPVMLSVRKENAPALSLYRRAGFDIVAENRGSWVMLLPELGPLHR